MPAAAPLPLTDIDDEMTDEQEDDYVDDADWQQYARVFVEQLGPEVTFTREMVGDFINWLPEEVSDRLFDVSLEELMGVQTMVIDYLDYLVESVSNNHMVSYHR